MPRGLVRYQQTGNFHFLTFSCYHRLPFLDTAASRELFESALERMRRRYNFVVAGYVVMPEHVHLLVGEPRNGLLARAVQALKLSVSVRRRERPFWQARYYDFNVHSKEKRIEKLRYMHRNPVIRGLCARPEDWRGRASAITRRARWGSWRSNRHGRLQGADRNWRLGGKCGIRNIEMDTRPGLKIETRGTPKSW